MRARAQPQQVTKRKQVRDTSEQEQINRVRVMGGL